MKHLILILAVICHIISAWKTRLEKVDVLRNILSKNGKCSVMPCCYDGLSARMIENEKFDVAFMTGFGVSAVNGLPDTGLISVHEMTLAAQCISRALINTPCIADGLF